VTSAGHDPPRSPLGRRHALELSGSPAAAVVPASTAVPAARDAKSGSATRRRAVLPDRWWFLIVFLVALAVFCATDSGRIFFDTKLGVDIDAREFLARLWSLWNPLEWLGSLQNQYIGYAIPMAPFFLIGQLLHVPIWLIERVWLSLLVAVGFTGLVKLARALHIGTDASRLLAGAVFALWPTFTILIGSTSASVLPGVLVPWAVLPLVFAVEGRYSSGRAAALSGLAVAAMGGVNAVCTLVVLVLPGLYILTHTKSRQRIRLSLQWAAAVLAATAWWVVPLLLQGRYAFNFLPYIEQSTTTTATLSAAAVLRGTGTWTAYFTLGGVPWVAAGWAMVTSAAAIAASAIVSATGLAGLARRDMPERRWLCISTGLVTMVALAGYYGPLGGPLHTWVDNLLNGTLAPFRSLYKIEPVIAVALALGCAHVLDRCWRLSIPVGRAKVAVSAATAPVVALVLVGLAWPQVTGQVLQAGSFTAVPKYWYQTAAYLAVHSPRNTALVVPANPHGQFTWGDTIDDPLEPLATSPWIERGLVPYGGAGSEVLLQTAEEAVESGQQVPGLAAYLARAGIRYVVVRNDTATDVSGYTAPQVVNETMAQSGFRRVAAFGPEVPAAGQYPSLVGVVPGFALSYPAVEIFEADQPALRPAGPVDVLPVSQTTLVNGGPDSLLQLDAQGILGSRPAVIAGQQEAGTPQLWAVTDGQRRADTDFGSTSDNQSYTYTATQNNPVDDPLGGAGGPPRQLLPVAAAGHETVAVLGGAASVTASSAGTWNSEAPQYDPAYAFDGNPGTAWAESSPYTPVGQWIQVNFDHQMTLPSSVGIQLLDDSGDRPVANELRVTTAAGSAVTDTVTTAATQRLRVPAGATGWLRITILGASNSFPGGLGAGISDVLIPGVRVTTYLQPAEDIADGASAPSTAYSFAQQVASPYGQGNADNVTASQSLDRTFVTPTADTLKAQLTAVPQAGSALTALIARLTAAGPRSFRVTASSTWDSLPVFGPDSMYEKARQPWISASDDPHPELEFSWRGERTISEIRLEQAYGVATAPTGVLLAGQHAFRLENVGLGGIVRISPALRTDRLYMTFPAVSSSTAGNPEDGQPSVLPVGLDTVVIPALKGLRAAVPNPAASFRLACGQGPAVTVDGHSYKTSVTGAIGDLTDLRPVQLHLCTRGGALNLSAGRHWLVTGASSDFTVSSLDLTTPGAASATSTGTSSRTVQILNWGSDNRSLRVGPGQESYLEVHENADAGWAATLNGRPLKSATLDGWQQAFVIPAGQGGTIALTFRPAFLYHLGLALSAVLLLLLLAFALGAGRLRLRRLRLARLRLARLPLRRLGLARFRLAGHPPADRPLPASPGAPTLAPPPSDNALVFVPAQRAGSPDGSWQPSDPQAPADGRSGRHRQPQTAVIRVPRRLTTASRPPVTRAGLAKGLALLVPLAVVVAVAGGPLVIAVPVIALIGYWRPRWLPAIAAVAMLAAGLLVLASPSYTTLGDGPFSGQAQVCALVALTAALLPRLTGPGRRQH
jgi:arabinofuranan 3-O-arabinosyltransferase